MYDPIETFEVDGECAAVLETSRANYYLDGDGSVIARTNGPRGWNYSRKWKIRGFLRRWNSGLHLMVSLREALDGADIGHGFPVDLDHGSTRTWSERATRIRRAAAFDQDTCARLRRVAP